VEGNKGYKGVTHTNLREDGQLIAAELDICGLRWLWRFGWLRPAELGCLLWPKAAHQRKQAEHLARRWRRQGLTIQRSLPERFGTALVLSEVGARLLRQSTKEPAKTGKDWGRVSGADWIPPHSWRHDLLGNGVLAFYAARGLEIVPEAELRRHSGPGKRADGLVFDENDGWWIEVENSRKSGQDQVHLIKTIVSIAEGRGPSFKDERITRIMIVLDPRSRDLQQDFFINHRKRITRAVKKVSRADIAITWAQVKLNHTMRIEKIEFDTEIIEADPVNPFLENLEWKIEGEIISAAHGQHVGATWPAEHKIGGFDWTILKNEDILRNGNAKNLDVAKRRIAENLLMAE
jgi:hypothetical protein